MILPAGVAPESRLLLVAALPMAAPLVACGVLKIVYDLAIWRAFRLVSPR